MSQINPDYKSRKFISFIICISLITIFFTLALILGIDIDSIVSLAGVISSLFGLYAVGNSVEHWSNRDSNKNGEVD